MKKEWIPNSEPLKSFSRYENKKLDKIKNENVENESQEDKMKNNIKFHLNREIAFMEDKFGDDKFKWMKENEDNYKMPKYFLERHYLRPETRTKMVDWMVEVFYIIQSDPGALQLAVYIMDSYITKTDKTLYDNNIHIIGLTCIYLSSKLLDDNPLKLIDLVESIGKNQFDCEDIIKKEKEISEKINYDFYVIGVNDYIFLLFYDLLVNQYKQIDKLKGKDIVNKYMDFCAVLSKLILYKEDLLSYKTSLITIGVIYFGLDFLCLKEKNINKELKHFLYNWVRDIINEFDFLPYDINCIYNEILKIYKVFIYQQIEHDKKSKIKKKNKNNPELINLAKYYREKLL